MPGMTLLDYAAAQRATRALAQVDAAAWPGEPCPRERGRLAESIIAAHNGWALWAKLPLGWRRAVSGEAGKDRGVDAVDAADGAVARFIQVKWLAAGSRIGHDPIARLISLAVQHQRSFAAPAPPACVLALNRDTTIVGDVPNASVVAVEWIDPRDFDTWVAELDQQPADSLDTPAPDFSFQDEAVSRLRAAPGPTVRCRMPPAAGKSRVIARLVAIHATPSAPVVVLAPRLEIVRQLAQLLAAEGDAHVATVVGGRLRDWREGVTRVVAASAQSAHALDGANARPWAAVLRDEAHVAEGGRWVAGLPAATRVYEFSASLAGAVDFEIETEELIRRGCACAPEFVFAVFAAEPSLGDVCAHLAAHPEYRSVLACFQSQRSAGAFVAECGARGLAAASCVSADGEAGNAALGEFRAGGLRVLAVVGRVEMGVDVHRCDTVLFVEPWDSDTRTLQLIGRGMRLHACKPGRFTVLIPAAAGASRDRRLRALVESLAGCGLTGGALAAVGVEAGVAAAPDTAPAALTGEGAAAPDEVRHDRFGNILDFQASADRLFEDHVRRQARAAVAARYSRCRAILARLGPARPRDYAEYSGFLAGLAEGDPRRVELPPDPARELGFGAGGRAWPDFLGAETPGGPMAADAAAAARVLDALGLDSVTDAGAGAAFYAQMREADPSLSPRTGTDAAGWAAYFAELRAALSE